MLTVAPWLVNPYRIHVLNILIINIMLATALNLVMFPIKVLGTEVLREILAGGQEVVAAMAFEGHRRGDEALEFARQ